MKDSGFEVDFGRTDGIVTCKVHFDMKNSLLIGCAFRTFNVCLPRKKISGIYDEQVLSKLFFGSIGGFFHQSLPIHSKLFKYIIIKMFANLGGSWQVRENA